MKGARSTLVMLVVLIALGAYVYFVELERPPASETPPNESLFEIEADDIVTLSITGSAGVTSLRRDDDDPGPDAAWRLTEPVAVEADDDEISSLTSTLASIEIQRIVDEGPVADLTPFGLAEPTVEVAFTVADADTEQRLLIGDATPTGADRYAKLAGADRVFLVSEFLESSLNKSTLDLRDKSLLAIDTTSVDTLRLELDATTLLFTKSDNAWRLEEPWDARADFATVEGLLGRLGTAEFREVITEDVTPEDSDTYGLEEPVVTVTVAMGSATARLLVGGDAGGGARYARDEARPLVFTIDPALADDLERPGEDYRQKDLFTFRSFNARRLHIERAEGEVTFEKVERAPDDEAPETAGAEEVWQRIGPSPLDVEASAMDDLVAQLSNLRADSFIPSRSDAGLDDDTLLATITATYGDDETEERVVLWRVGEDTYGVHGSEPGAAVIDTRSVDEALEALEVVAQLPAPSDDESP